MRVLVHAPRLLEGGLKSRHIDGEALAVYAGLREAGHEVSLLDSYYRHDVAPTLTEHLTAATAQAPRAPMPEVVLTHLWTSDAYGPRLAEIAADLAAARQRWSLPVVAFGPLATSAEADLRAVGAVDHVVRPGPPRLPWPTLDMVLARFFAQEIRLGSLTAADLPYGPDSIVSVAASSGCRARCTFCAYQADLAGGWHPGRIDDAVDDLAHLHRITGATRFAFSDSDFGGTRTECRNRAAQLLTGMRRHGLDHVVRLSISIRSETLDQHSVADLAAAGVRTMLIGIESLNPDTVHRLYGKRMDLDHLHHVIEAADEHGVTVVASYILWHPWQTPAALHAELDEIEQFGRHRIPQFMARSRLLVIPGTVLEARLRRDGLLESAPFHRGFRFTDPDIARLDDQLRDWFDQHVIPRLAHLSDQRPNDIDTLARLKIAEWQFLRGVTADPAPPDTATCDNPAAVRS